MAKFPEPPSPDALRRLRPQIRTLPATTELWRIYFRGGQHPTLWNTFRSYGPLRSRFDHQVPPPHLQRREVLYAAGQGLTCLAELFQDTRLIDREARSPWLVCFALERAIPLLDLSGTWPTRAGASMVLSSGPRPRAQRWSRAIYDAYPQLDGIWYPSSMHANRPAVCLWERAKHSLPASPAFHRRLSDAGLLSVLKHAARQLGYGLA